MTPLEKTLCDYVDTHAEELYALLSELIQYDTQNFVTHGRELECARHIAALYRSLDLETELYFPDSIPGLTGHRAYLPGRGTDARPNVHGILRGEDPEDWVLLAAHIDTMPIGDESAWSVPPLGGVVRDGRLWGRGSGDNKFGIAGAFFAVQTLRRLGVRLRKTVVLGAYCDEEYGGGNGALGLCLRTPCDTIVNLDGGNYELWTAALGGSGYHVEVRVRDATDTAEPVILGLTVVLDKLRPFVDWLRAGLHADPLYTGTQIERSVFRIHDFSAGRQGADLDSGYTNFVIYTVFPQEAVDARLQAALDEAQAELTAMGLVVGPFVRTTRFFPFGRTEDIHGAAACMRQCAAEAAGRPVRECGSCLTDLSVFMTCGTASSFNFGIMRDFSLYGGAHQPDEYIELDQFRSHTKALLLFLLRHCGVV